MKTNDLLVILGAFANLAQIAGFLASRKKFARFWARTGRVIGIILVMFVVVALLSWAGWLEWINTQVTWPVWALILFGLPWFVILGALFVVIADFIQNGKAGLASARLVDHFDCHGVRWYFKGKTFVDRPPYCLRCDLPMLSLRSETLHRPDEVWQCPDCEFLLEWDGRTRGDLLYDVRERYAREARREYLGSSS